MEAGEAIPTLPRKFEVKAGEGHRSGITKGDELSQIILLSRLAGTFPEARFLCEEDSSHSATLSKTNPEGILDKGLRFVLDSLDSTARYGSEMDGWSVVAGTIQDGEIEGSAVFAPASNGGILVSSARGEGIITAEWDGNSVDCRRLCGRVPTPAKKSVILLGVDTLLYNNVTAITPRIAANVRAIFTSGSGALGLAWVACGRAQAIIQTPQKAWDWAGAYRSVIEGGNVFRFFRIVDGNLVPAETYDFESFRTFKDSNANRLGFVAGEPEMTDRLFDLLPRTGWERTIPDTVSGTW